MSTEESTKACPFCAETIKSAAIVCRFCGRDLPAVPAAATEQTPTPAAPVIHTPFPRHIVNPYNVSAPTETRSFSSRASDSDLPPLPAAPYQPPAPAQTATGISFKGIAGGLAIAFVGVFIAFSFSTATTNARDPQIQKANAEAAAASATAEKAKEKRKSAYYTSQAFVEDRLKSPKTADFLPYDDALVTDLDNKMYRINATVDSENSFGAMMHADYSVTLQDTEDGSFKLMDIDLKQRE